jgi:hypothetical protein
MNLGDIDDFHTLVVPLVMPISADSHSQNYGIAFHFQAAERILMLR